MTEPEDHGRVNVANWNGKYPKGAGSSTEGMWVRTLLHRIRVASIGETVTDAWLMTSTARLRQYYGGVNLRLGFGHAHTGFQLELTGVTAGAYFLRQHCHTVQ
jgi:hypothetical protein